MIVNNFTKIYKTNKHLSPQAMEHQKDHNIGNPGPSLGQVQTCGMLYLLIGGTKPPPLISSQIGHESLSI